MGKAKSKNFRIIAAAFLWALILSSNSFANASPDSDAASDRKTVVHDNNAFALELYAKLAAQDGNIFISPGGISTTLALTYSGAKGDTADEMAKVLHFTLPPARLHPALSALMKSQTAGSIAENYKLDAACALWVQKDYRIQADFIKFSRDEYDCDASNVSFGTDEAKDAINHWNSSKTGGKIGDLIAPGSLDDGTRLVITDIVHFKGQWSNPFFAYKTDTQSFYVTAKQSVAVPMMHRFDEMMFNYFENDKLQAIALPYKGDDLFMMVLLPKAREGLHSLEKGLSLENIHAWLSSMASTRFDGISLPKFKMTTSSNIADSLKTLGMDLAFNQQANFSGITGKKDIFISKLLQKSYIDVNEFGTEAASSTVTEAHTLSLEEKPPPVFLADHPFFFLILDNRTGSILFLGRVENPLTDGQ